MAVTSLNGELLRALQMTQPAPAAVAVTDLDGVANVTLQMTQPAPAAVLVTSLAGTLLRALRQPTPATVSVTDLDGVLDISGALVLLQPVAAVVGVTGLNGVLVVPSAIFKTHATILGAGVSEAALLGAGVSQIELLGGDPMLTDQDVLHVRGNDLRIPVLVSLDEGRDLDGSELWKWALKKNQTTAELLGKTHLAGITVDGTTFQPTIVLTAGDFLPAKYPDALEPLQHIHELQMTKDTKVEAVLRGQFTVLTPVVGV